MIINDIIKIKIKTKQSPLVVKDPLNKRDKYNKNKTKNKFGKIINKPEIQIKGKKGNTKKYIRSKKIFSRSSKNKNMNNNKMNLIFETTLEKVVG